MWKQGEDILHAAFGESRFPVHPDLSKALNNGISNRSYLSSLGTKRLRAKIAHYYTKKLNKINKSVFSVFTDFFSISDRFQRQI